MVKALDIKEIAKAPNELYESTDMKIGLDAPVLKDSKSVKNLVAIDPRGGTVDGLNRDQVLHRLSVP